MGLTLPKGLLDTRGTPLGFSISFAFPNTGKKGSLIQQTFLRHLL